MIRKSLSSFLDKHLPESKYSDGKDAKCVIYRLCNVFDMIDD